MSFSSLRYRRMTFALELLVVAAFLGSLYWNVDTFAKIEKARNQYAELQRLAERLDVMEKKIARFNRLKDSYFFPNGDAQAGYHWEDVSLWFGPLEFPRLLSRLNLLGQEIENKYHKRGIFVLTRFRTVRQKKQDADQAEPTDGPARTLGRPGFEIRGRLLCLRQ